MTLQAVFRREKFSQRRAGFFLLFCVILRYPCILDPYVFFFVGNIYVHSTDMYDQRILALLQEESSLSTAEIAERIGLSQSPCWRRIQRLKEEG